MPSLSSIVMSSFSGIESERLEALDSRRVEPYDLVGGDGLRRAAADLLRKHVRLGRLADEAEDLPARHEWDGHVFLVLVDADAVHLRGLRRLAGLRPLLEIDKFFGSFSSGDLAVVLVVLHVRSPCWAYLMYGSGFR